MSLTHTSVNRIIKLWGGITAAIALTAALTQPAMADTPASIDVDFTQRIPNVHSMVGFLHSINATTPPDPQLLLLRPALWRIGFQWLQNRDRLAQLSVPTVMVLSDNWGSRVPNSQAEWETYVHATGKNANGQTYVWDIMNEPDLNGSWKGTREQFFDLFVHGTQAIRQQLGPATRVSGPSISHYDAQFITGFLDYCKAHELRVDVLSWHELDDDDHVHSITEHLREARQKFLDNPAYKSLGIQQIQINEIVGPTAQYRPGEILGYFDALEQGGADGACKGCWDDSQHSSNCANNTLDGLLTPDTHAPRAAWWAYKCYADTVAARVASRVSDSRLAAFAASGSSTTTRSQTATIVVGYSHDRVLPTDPINVALHLAGLNKLPFINKRRRIHVRVEKIPDVGEQPLLQLERIAEQDTAIERGAATVLLPTLAQHEAVLVTLSKAL